MSSEAAFIAAIAANPDDDLPRLVFADWLEENGQKERADYIRLAIQFDPHRDRFDDEAINATREKLVRFEQPALDADGDWLEGWSKRVRWGVTVERRRGFVDSVAIPVQWWIDYGTAFRERFPTLRKLVLFRLNGWGERLAACESLRGLQELELACWYEDEDATAVANCPHLLSVERLTLWDNGETGQALTFARGTFRKKLKDLRLVARGWGPDGWTETVNKARRRKVATVYDFGKELFPFAPDFGGGADSNGFYVGRMPDDSQLFALGGPTADTLDGWLFHPDGKRREQYSFAFPKSLVLSLEVGQSPDLDWRARHDEEQQFLRRRADHFRKRTGFIPAFIRVEGFRLPVQDLSGPLRFREAFDDHWGQIDDPDQTPEQDDWEVGHGGKAYQYVRDGEFSFDFGNDWWCDRTGQVTST